MMNGKKLSTQDDWLVWCYNCWFLNQETQRLVQEPVPGIAAVPDEANARYFHVVVDGIDGVFFVNFSVSNMSNSLF